MCCLKYENEYYEEVKELLPDWGAIVETPLGEGKVVTVHVLEKLVKVHLLDAAKVVTFHLDEIQQIVEA